MLLMIADPDYQTELGQFNIEFNIDPGRSKAAWSASSRSRCAEPQSSRDGAPNSHARLLMIGILPTLTGTCQGDGLSANPRYALLNEQIFAARGEDLHLDIDGSSGVALRRHDRSRGRVHERAVAPAQSIPAISPTTGTRLRSSPGSSSRSARTRPSCSAASCGRRPGSRCSSRPPTPGRRSSRPRACARASGSASAGSPRSSTCSRRTSGTSRRCCPWSTHEEPAGGVRRRRDAAAAGAAPAQRHDLPLEPPDLRRRAAAARTCGSRTGCSRPARPWWTRSPTPPSTTASAGAGGRGSSALDADVVLGGRGELPRGARDGHRRARVYWPGVGEMPATELCSGACCRWPTTGFDLGSRPGGPRPAARHRRTPLQDGRNGAQWQVDTVRCLDEHGAPRPSALREMTRALREQAQQRAGAHLARCVTVS